MRYDFDDGYHNAYAERWAYNAPHAWVHPEEHSPYHYTRLTPEMERRRLRAFADRDLACRVDATLYDMIGPDADTLAVYADEAVVTIEGVVPDRDAAAFVLDVVRDVPGVRRVRSELRIPRRRY